MKFVIVFGFFSAIVFDGFNFGEAVTVAEAQPALAQLFIDLAYVIGTPADEAKAKKNAFNDPKRSYKNIAQLTEVADRRFKLQVNFYESVNYYKSEERETEYGRLESALNNYVNNFSGEIAGVKAKMQQKDEPQNEEDDDEDEEDSSDQD